MTRNWYTGWGLISINNTTESFTITTIRDNNLYISYISIKREYD